MKERKQAELQKLTGRRTEKQLTWKGNQKTGDGGARGKEFTEVLQI